MRFNISFLFFITCFSCTSQEIDLNTKVLHQVDKRPALPFPPGVTTESQCGKFNDQQDVETYDGNLGVSSSYVDKNELSTVLFQWQNISFIEDTLSGFLPGNIANQRWCSGTLIDVDIVLTAGHCFDIQKSSWKSPYKITSDDEIEYAEPKSLAKVFQVKFKYQINGQTGALRKGISFPVAELLEYRINNLDYALVKIGRNSTGKLPGELYPVAKVLGLAPLVSDKIAIIQHPQGKPKKIDAGNIVQLVGNSIYYSNIDTEGGSSGSGIRDKNGYLIGVHTNGGCNANSGANRGVSNISIISASDIL